MFRRCLAALVLSTATLASAADLPAYPFIHVDATGFTAAPPDIGQLDFEINAVHADPAQALRVMDERAAQIRAIVEQAGLSLDDVSVRDIRTEMTKGDTPSYDMRAGVKIIVRDVSRWKALVEPILALPNLDGFMTAFDITSRAQIEDGLMADAIRQARRKADVMAAALGRKVLSVGGVSTGPIKNLARSMELAPSDYREERRAGSQATRGELIAVTAIKLAQPVDVIFRLK